MRVGTKKYLTASSILIGSCIGAGILGIPYVASKAGFLITLIYIILIGGLVLLVNLYLGEIALRTKGDHQLIGYAEKYLGKKAKHLMAFATIFGIYAALIAYILGIGESLSFLFFNNENYAILFGVLFGALMSWLLKGGISSLKKFEKFGVAIIIFLIFTIGVIFLPDIKVENFLTHNFSYLLLPFGVILFSFLSFHTIPDVKIVLKRHEKNFKKTMITGTLVSIILYIIFTLVILGALGENTPEVATLALGKIFVFLGVFTMFTSYLSAGNSLCETYKFDERYSEKISWFLGTIVPIILFLATQTNPFFSFTKILSLGGVIYGGMTAILILIIVKKAKTHANRKSEYSIPWNAIIILAIILVFLFSIFLELFSFV
jgi:tyrosine-specific transport protein